MKHPDLQGDVDIIIEDGLRTFEADVDFLEGTPDYSSPGWHLGPKPSSHH